MSESGSEGIERKTTKVLQRTSSRREVLKGVKTGFVGLMAAYGAGSLGRDIAKGDNPAKGAYDIFKTTPKVSFEAVLSKKEIPFSEDPFIREIEERLSVRLVSLRQAYEIMGFAFDEHDSEEFGDVLPMRWDHERAQMISDYFNFLPHYFHEPDKNGDPLMITLTNFANDSNVAADYHMHSSQNLMRIDYDCFTRQNEPGSLKLLAHECIHYMQDQGYSRLDSALLSIFDTNDITKFCAETIDWLDNRPEDESDEEFATYEQLRYGVQNILHEKDPDEPRGNLVEFEAVLGEVYLQGREFFIAKLSNVYGDKAEKLYEYMRDTIFGGKEYDHFPIPDAKEITYDIRKDADFIQAVSTFNTVTKSFLRTDTRTNNNIPFLNPDNEALQQNFTTGRLTASSNPVTSVATNESGTSTSVSFDTIKVKQNRTNQGVPVNEYLTFYIDSSGKVNRDGTPVEIDHARMADMAHNLFEIPQVAVPEWFVIQQPNNSDYSVLLRYDVKGYHYEMSLHENGSVICRMHKISTESAE